jgi:hypothetical protein
VIVTDAVAVAAAHPPLAGIEFVTIYVPAVLADRLICPVLAFTKTNPAVDVNVPALPDPMKVGEGLAADLQYGPA